MKYYLEGSQYQDQNQDYLLLSPRTSSRLETKGNRNWRVEHFDDNGDCTGKALDSRVTDPWCTDICKDDTNCVVADEYSAYCKCISGGTPSQTPKPTPTGTPKPTPTRTPKPTPTRTPKPTPTPTPTWTPKPTPTRTPTPTPTGTPKPTPTGTPKPTPTRTPKPTPTRTQGPTPGVTPKYGNCSSDKKIVNNPNDVFQIDQESFAKGCYVSQDCNNYCHATGPNGCEMCGVTDEMGITCGSVGIMNRDNATTGPDNPDILTEDNIDEYMKYSCPLPNLAKVKMNDGTYKSIGNINPNYLYNGKTRYQNWCSGANMHFDLTNNPIGPGDNDLGDHYTGDYLLKYRPVSCRDWGWDAENQAGDPTGSTDNQPCPNPGGDTPDWLRDQIETYNPEGEEKKWQGIATWSIVGSDPNFCGGSIVYPKEKVKNGKLTSTDGRDRDAYANLAAIPYTNICKTYGKTQADVKNNKTGTKYGYKQNYGSKDSICWEMQAVPTANINLDKLKWEQGGLCTGDGCRDLNDITHEGAPLHIAQAATACGGNCRGIPEPCNQEGQQKYQISTAYYPTLNPSQQEAIDNCMPRRGPSGSGTSCYSLITTEEYEADQEDADSPYKIACAEDIISLAKESIPNKNIGGWTMNSGGVKTAADDYEGTVICNGYFQSDGKAGPPTTSWENKVPSGKKYYITLGGQDISSDIFPSDLDNFLEKKLMGNYTASGFNKGTGFGLGSLYNGLDFDFEFSHIESGTSGLTNEQLIGNDSSKNKIVTLSHKALFYGYNVQWTVMGNVHNKKFNGIPYNVLKAGIDRVRNQSDKSVFNKKFTLCLMLYGGSMGNCDITISSNAPYGDWGIPDKYWYNQEAITNTVNEMKQLNNPSTSEESHNPFMGTLGYLADWIIHKDDNGVPLNQINLGVSTIGCTRGMIQLYIKLCQELGFAGILFWRFGYCRGISGSGSFYCGTNWDQINEEWPCNTSADCGKHYPGKKAGDDYDCYGKSSDGVCDTPTDCWSNWGNGCCAAYPSDGKGLYSCGPDAEAKNEIRCTYVSGEGDGGEGDGGGGGGSCPDGWQCNDGQKCDGCYTGTNEIKQNEDKTAWCCVPKT